MNRSIRYNTKTTHSRGKATSRRPAIVQLPRARVQPKLFVHPPGDRFEREADRVADQVMRGTASLFMPRLPESPLGPSRATEVPGDQSPASNTNQNGHDFRNVRVHAVADRELTQFPAQQQTATTRHVSEHGSEVPVPPVSCLAAPPMIQRELIATSATDLDLRDFINLVQPAIGQELIHDPATSRIRAVGSLPTPARSPAARSIMTRIMDDPDQHAEIHIGRGQFVVIGGQALGVMVGAFPEPRDLTGDRIHIIDIDDVLAIERGAPGNGVAALIHEIEENYYAHSLPVVAGTERRTESHERGIEAQSRVAEELVGPGSRVAMVFARVAGTVTAIVDFENYYVVSDLNLAPGDISFTRVRRVGKINLATYTIDRFRSEFRAVPPTGALTITNVVGDLAANPTATVRIEGFTDDRGDAAFNDSLGQHRAEHTRQRIIDEAAGVAVGPARFHAVGRGATNFVNTNDTPENRALNRRVEISVDRPDL